jgi:DNA-binding CsgD family transcriptional regulator
VPAEGSARRNRVLQHVEVGRRPHLGRRYDDVRARRRTAVAREALETCDEPLVLIGGDGRPEFGTASARRLLEARGFDLADVPEFAPLRARNIGAGVLRLEEARPLGLTGREREILTLVGRGDTNAQAAAALRISPATVGKHLENAYSKLGVRTRTAAVRRLNEHDARPSHLEV